MHHACVSIDRRSIAKFFYHITLHVPMRRTNAWEKVNHGIPTLFQGSMESEDYKTCVNLLCNLSPVGCESLAQTPYRVPEHYWYNATSPLAPVEVINSRLPPSVGRPIRGLVSKISMAEIMPATRSAAEFGECLNTN
jgi:hypothetical protein